MPETQTTSPSAIQANHGTATDSGNTTSNAGAKRPVGATLGAAIGGVKGMSAIGGALGVAKGAVVGSNILRNRQENN